MAIKVFEDEQFLVLKTQGTSLFGPIYELYLKKRVFLLISRRKLVKRSIRLETIEADMSLIRRSADFVGLSEKEANWASKVRLP